MDTTLTEAQFIKEAAAILASSQSEGAAKNIPNEAVEEVDNNSKKNTIFITLL